MAGTISYQPFIYQDINNGILTAIKAMPQKDINSAGNSDFAQPREQYVRVHSNIPQSNEVKIQKKWIGGNQDSSSVTERRRFNAIGNGSLNAANKSIKFSQHNDINTTYDALVRVRGAGYVTSQKVRHKPATVGDAMTPKFPAGPLVRSQFQAPVDVLGDPTNGQYTTMRLKEPVNNFIPVLPNTGYFNIYRKRQVSNFQPVFYH